ncbi:RNAse (barnase) inhibitor barstar [Sphingopyxis italica]|uniref:RNAse (Barnase) inhibitor barstar n=1 Tax=Sphingopyxis italica TaxID=1129133 RepID=A0A7X5XRC1_9SPHN|nr:barstar family protein [Sphingopyxis italica]NJB89873.1 RNAse (barnase) inhibitor barstar [Sphingopyxis italica]
MATTVNLDGNIIDSETLFHTAFRDASGVEWYGGNLDALFDLMVGVVSGPINIVWTNAARSRSTIGERFDRLLTVIFDAIAYRGDGSINLRLES